MPSALQPKPEDYAYDLDRALSSVVAAAVQQLKQMRNASGVRRLVEGRRYLYELPWYLVIGRADAGKTSAIGGRRSVPKSSCTSTCHSSRRISRTKLPQAEPSAPDYASIFEVSYRSCSHCGWRVHGRYHSRQEADQAAQTLRSQGNEVRIAVH